MTFSDFNFHPDIMEGIDAIGFKEPTPIQQMAIPHILGHSDLIGCAQTGTGKTAAYILPVLHHIAQSTDKTNVVKTLIIAPTRELALQIDQHFQGFSYFTPVTSIAVYGGSNAQAWDQQKKAIIQGADIVIATPGRLIAHLQLGYVKFDKLQHLILDEADRMLDMGFYEDIMQIISHLPKKRQNLLFSATMPPKIREMAKKILHEPKEVNIAIAKPAEKIIQGAYVVYDKQKIPLIQDLLAGKEVENVLIFSATKKNVRALTRELSQIGFAAKAIHSDLEQKEREEILQGFKNKDFKVLVATDILSRGIDIENISLIINFDIPQDPEDYVHRIGRTARADADGLAISLINRDDYGKFVRIEKMVEQEIFKIPVPNYLGKSPSWESFKKSGQKNSPGNFRNKRSNKPRKPRGSSKKPKRNNKNKN